jgi:hypothetical protein
VDACRDFIRTVPALPHDEAKPEDIDTDAEDHSADAARYAAMSRPWAPPVKREEPAPDRYAFRRRWREGGQSGSGWAA